MQLPIVSLSYRPGEIECFPPTNSIKLDLPPCPGAFPPTCALRKHNPKNSSRNLVEQKPDNAIPVALRGLSARKQEVNTSRTVCGIYCMFFFMRCIIITLWTRLIFSQNQTQHTIKTNADRVYTHTLLYACMPVTAPIEIWLILPVVICLFQGLSHACLRITALQDSAHGSLHQT